MPTSVNSLPVLLSAQGRYEKAEHLGLLVAPLCLEQLGQVAHGRECVRVLFTQLGSANL